MNLETEGVQKARNYKGWPGQGELWAEPKIDGYRMHAMIGADGTVALRTRRCTEPYDQNLAHVAAQIATLGLRDCMIDGEIVAADFGSTAVVRRKALRLEHVEALERIQFHAFDLVPLEALRPIWVRVSERRTCREEVERIACMTPLRDRRRALVDALDGRELDNVQLTSVTPVCSTADVITATTRALDDGYEGTMIKDPNSPYLFGDRAGWWKVKPFRSVDAVIVGYIEGTGQNEGALGALIVRDASGSTFRVGTGFHSALRRECWDARDGLIGAVIEAKVQMGSRARHPSFLRFRPDLAS